jgi:hypothetical protein
VAHCVLPGTQNPPTGVEMQTQSGLAELQAMKVEQVAPTHSGCELLTPWAIADCSLKLAATSGAAYAIFAPVLTIVRRVV